jgi:DUF4097 and DUF4098 domain-containing protein YvlB
MGGKLWVLQRDGSVDVEGWEKPEVSIQARFEDGSRGKAHLEVRQVAGGLEIEVKEPPRPRILFGFYRSPKCHLTLKVPRKLSMVVRTVDGNITVKHLEGYAGCQSVDGDIRLEDLAGEAHVKTVDGAIEARRLRARMMGGTVDGNIVLDRVEGGIHLKTVDGAITAEDLDGWGEGISLTTVDGNIQVRLGGATGILDAQARDGRIRQTHPRLQLQEASSGRLRGVVPGRSQEIRLRTGDGSIAIR